MNIIKVDQCAVVISFCTTCKRKCSKYCRSISLIVAIYRLITALYKPLGATG